MALPPAPFDACDKQGTRVSSLSLVRYRSNDYSAPVAYGHQEVWIRGYVHEVVIGGMSRLLLKFVQQALLVEQARQPWPSVQGRG